MKTLTIAALAIVLAYPVYAQQLNTAPAPLSGEADMQLALRATSTANAQLERAAEMLGPAIQRLKAENAARGVLSDYYRAACLSLAQESSNAYYLDACASPK